MNTYFIQQPYQHNKKVVHMVGVVSFWKPVPALNLPIYEKQKMIVTESKCIDHPQWPRNTKSFEQLWGQVLPIQFWLYSRRSPEAEKIDHSFQ